MEAREPVSARCVEWAAISSRGELDQANSSAPANVCVVLIFSHAGCPRCPAAKAELRSTVAELAEKGAGVEVLTVNTFDSDTEELTELLGVTQVPFVIVFNRGAEVLRGIGKHDVIMDVKKTVESLHESFTSAPVLTLDADF